MVATAPRMRRSVQAPSSVVMVRPHHFCSNPQTRADNAFQRSDDGLSADDVRRAAYAEVTEAAAVLESHGVTTHVFDDEREDRPDAVFPNNWFSTHSGGHVALYPMEVVNRRRERRSDIIDMLKQRYRVQDVIDYSGLEADGLSLEGTGAMVLDHVDRVAYVARSRRADPIALERFCTHFNFEPMVFDAVDENGTPIYHTNVLMCIGTEFAMVGVDHVADRRRRAEVIDRLQESGRDIIALSHRQIAEFAGNAIELQGDSARLLALSSRAHASLTSDQRAIIERSCRLLPLQVPTIELAGGSVRCMLAGVHLTPR
ncbi:citrulline utilization hydrolase CtlX [Granulosicoccus sp. 3-233]|uniref:citrulline utilization hydrolase CtlX n=1 Tax=Granulosicoccus sp. 3-233 TaxID=3417969 RepID=UPI003D334095